MTSARVTSTSTVVLALLALAGCSGSEPSAAPTSGLASATSTAVAPTSDPVHEAEQQALAVVPAYVETVDGLYADPARSLEDIYDVAVAPEATNEASAVQAFRAQGYSQVGSSTVVSSEAGAVDLTNDPSAATPVLPSVAVTVCLDVSQVSAVDDSGASVVAADRPDFLISDLTVVNIAYPDSASWRVSEAPNRQAQSCAG